jgi:molecular chaperone DnaK
VKEQVEKLKETLKGDDIDAIKADSEELTKRFYALSEKLYKATGGDAAAADAASDTASDADGNVYSNDYEVKDEGDGK